MDKYGIIGYPLGHSYSRGFFTDKFRKEGVDAEYVNFPIPSVEQLPNIVRDNPELRGLNVTLPHKQAVIPMLDELSDEACQIGAVNVIRVRRKYGKAYLKGFNSDIIGFMDSIRPLLKPSHRKALILGTGGASRAVRVGLERLGVEWSYVSRTPCSGQYAYDALTPDVMSEHTVIVNCSPVGMFPKSEECPAIPYNLLTPAHLLFDVVYNPEETLFMKRGAEQGATVKNGLEMLRLQAVASWEFWNSED